MFRTNTNVKLLPWENKFISNISQKLLNKLMIIKLTYQEIGGNSRYRLYQKYRTNTRDTTRSRRHTLCDCTARANPADWLELTEMPLSPPPRALIPPIMVRRGGGARGNRLWRLLTLWFGKRDFKYQIFREFYYAVKINLRIIGSVKEPLLKIIK